MIKEEVISLLLAAREPVSGEQICRQLGVTRAAVWKAIDQLRQEGYTIEAAPRRGYTLTARPDRLDTAQVRGYLAGHPWQPLVTAVERVDSTNNACKRLAAEGAPDGTAVLTGMQTAGRGRRGRSFYSPGGLGLYLSVLLRPQAHPAELLHLTAMSAVAASRAVEAVCGVRPGIKWTNDLVFGTRKLAGILTELSVVAETMETDYVVVGIGVNVASAGFPEELREVATSMFGDVGNPPRDRVAAAILNLLFEKLETLPQRTFMDEYRARSCVIGREITMTDFSAGGEQVTARALDVDDDGGLVVETASGVRTLHSGEVSVRVRKSKEEQSE